MFERRGLPVGSPDEVAFRNGWITPAELAWRAALFSKSTYGQYLEQLRAEP